MPEINMLNTLKDIVEYLMDRHRLAPEDFNIRVAGASGLIYLAFRRTVDEDTIRKVVENLREQIPPNLHLIVEMK